MKENLRVIKKLISKNEMTRSGNIRKETTKIIVTCFKKYNIFEYLNTLNIQDENYLSYNYIILEDGNIYKIVPEKEVSYATYSIKENLECISIGIYCNNNINKEELRILKLLLNDICYRNNLILNKNVFLEYDIYNTRTCSYFIDNYYLWKEVLK